MICVRKIDSIKNLRISCSFFSLVVGDELSCCSCEHQRCTQPWRRLSTKRSRPRSTCRRKRSVEAALRQICVSPGRLLARHNTAVPRPRANATDAPTPWDAIDDLPLSLPPTLASPRCGFSVRVEPSTVQIYRSQFKTSPHLTIEADMRAVAAAPEQLGVATPGQVSIETSIF
jgi:hypothetical protein